MSNPSIMTRGKGIYPDVGRKTPATGAHIFFGQENVFFVTVCAKDRITWMADSHVKNLLVSIWKAEATAWLVDFYLIMPDHIHLFCAPRDLHFNIDQWITFWKRRFSRQNAGQSWEWQRRAFHHRIRDRKEYDEKLTYVRENPIRKGLTRDVNEWPFQGIVHELRWTTG